MSVIRTRIEQLPHAKGLELPHFATDGSAGADVRAAVLDPLTILPGALSLVPTGLRLAIPRGYEVQVRPRSGLAFKSGIIVPNSPGTIDSDYRGELQVILMNLGSSPFTINRGDRIAQLVMAKVERIEWEFVENLDTTARGEGGFGHTGV
jgi:dUTP pyrophosphatase